MAIAISQHARVSQDDNVMWFGTIALDAAYPTGGYAITANNFKLNRIRTVHLSDAGGFSVTWDAANSKIKVFQGDNANAAAAPGSEVPNGTDLSALTSIPVLVTGV